MASEAQIWSILCSVCDSADDLCVQLTACHPLTGSWGAAYQHLHTNTALDKPLGCPSLGLCSLKCLFKVKHVFFTCLGGRSYPSMRSTDRHNAWSLQCSSLMCFFMLSAQTQAASIASSSVGSASCTRCQHRTAKKQRCKHQTTLSALDSTGKPEVSASACQSTSQTILSSLLLQVMQGKAAV